MHDQAATDTARAAVQIDEIVDPAAGAEQVLGHSAEGCVVADDDRQAGRFGCEFVQRHIVPPEVRCVPHHPVGTAHETVHGEAEAHEPRIGEFVGAPLLDRLGHQPHRLGRSEQMVDLDATARRNRAGEPYGGQREGVDLRVCGDRHDRRMRRHDR